MNNDTLVTIIAIGISATLLFVFPLMTIADRNDDVAQQSYQKATVEFVDKVCNVGSVDEATLTEYQEKLNATGHPADVKMEIKVLDDNVGKKTTWTSSSVVGENVYYSVYTEPIEEQVYGAAGKYPLKAGDIFSATATNKDMTIGQALRNGFYAITGRGTYRIKGEHASVSKNNGSISQ